jgi:hypothetical protein
MALKAIHSPMCYDFGNFDKPLLADCIAHWGCAWLVTKDDPWNVGCNKPGEVIHVDDPTKDLNAFGQTGWWEELIKGPQYNVTREAEPAKQEPAFPSAARATMEKCSSVFAQREGEYKDTWALENQVTTMLDHVLKVIDIGEMSTEEKRLVLVAALCDVKDSRMIGDYKEDSHLDAINYRMTLAKWLDDYVNPKDTDSPHS